uniref:class I SAM-dependent methyltransferase n=1 Tax=Polynucleobacter sp. TaxID=2029855 RepID=UPI004048BCC0
MEKALCKNCGQSNVYLYVKLMPKIFGNKAYSITLCESCGVGGTAPEPDATLDHYIDSDRPEIINVSVKKMMKREIAGMMNEYQKINGEYPKSLLDVGCGNGLFLLVASEMGLTTLGIEPSTSMCSNAAKKGVQVISCGLEEYTRYDQFDLVVLNSVIEHLPEPRKVMKLLADRIGDKTMLCLQQAVFDGLIPRALKSTWYGWAPAEHYWHFSEKSFKNFTETFQLRVVKARRSNLYYQTVSIKNIRHWKSFVFGNFQKLLSLVGSLIQRGDSITFYVIKT